MVRIFLISIKDHVLLYLFFCLQPGWYITIYVVNVPATKWNAYKSAQLVDNVIVYGLLPHEHQMSVVNAVLKRIPDSEVPIKSKERLIIQCGYRRFVVNPIFSQHTNGDKHKVRRKKQIIIFHIYNFLFLTV